MLRRTARFASRECGAELTRGSSLSQNGAIAQLGERVLCKHEVVGSIPSGSTRRLIPKTSSLKDEITSFAECLRTIGGLLNIVKRKCIQSLSTLAACSRKSREAFLDPDGLHTGLVIELDPEDVSAA